MKVRTFYQCEYCWSEYQSAKEAYKCEADCLKLTMEEYKEYVDMLNRAKTAGYIVSRTKNTDTEKLFDDCIKELVDFEEKHHIICVR